MRIGRSYSGALQTRRVVLLADHLLVLHIASLLHYSLLLNHVVLHAIGVVHDMVVIRSVGKGSADAGSLSHRLIHIVGVGHSADHVRTSHLDVVVRSTAELVAADVLVKYYVAIGLVRVFLNDKLKGTVINYSISIDL